MNKTNLYNYLTKHFSANNKITKFLNKTKLLSRIKYAITNDWLVFYSI